MARRGSWRRGSEGGGDRRLHRANLCPSFGYDQRMVMAGSVISVIPVLVLFVITQRWFYKGVSSGAVKL